MSDFLVALALVLVIEGLMFAAFPGPTKRLMTSAMETPDGQMRVIGIVCAIAGVIFVWLIRG
ncbi:MAG: DUF2065 domain-containing protein [Hyphomicrobiales bacterium]